MIKFKILKEVGLMTISQYAEGGMPAIMYYNNQGELLFTLTVNLPQHNWFLNDWEFFAKTWSENAMVTPDLMLSGHFADTGRKVKTGHVDAEIWVLTNRGQAMVTELKMDHLFTGRVPNGKGN
jgi:hypothetical protein